MALYFSLLVFVGLLNQSFAVEDVAAPVLCNPPKIIPDAEKAPLIYYSTDSKHCDKVTFYFSVFLFVLEVIL